MKRFVDWDLRLIEYATAVRGMPFEWGNTNCAALVAGCVDAMTGSDLFQFQRDLGLTEEKARELSRQRFTRSTLLEAGLRPVESKLFIQRGDIVLSFSEGWECGHVCLGKYVLSSSPEHGVFYGRLSVLKVSGEQLEVLRCP